MLEAVAHGDLLLLTASLVGQVLERRILVLVLRVQGGVVRLFSTTIYWENDLRIILKMMMFYVALLRLNIPQRAAEFLQTAMGVRAQLHALVQ